MCVCVCQVSLSHTSALCECVYLLPRSLKPHGLVTGPRVRAKAEQDKTPVSGA